MADTEKTSEVVDAAAATGTADAKDAADSATTTDDTGKTGASDLADEYTVSDYGSFDEAAATVKDLREELGQEKDDVADCLNTLKSEDVFFGPVATSCLEYLSKLHDGFDTLGDNFTTIDGYLAQILSNYKEGDLQGSNLILRKDENGKLAMVTYEDVDPTNEKQIYETFVSELERNGMDTASAKVAAASMMGNAYRETGHTYDPALVSKAGTSYGIFQWRNGTVESDQRWNEVVKWCEANGYEAASLAGQIAYACYDVTKGRYYDVGNHFTNSEKSAAGASEQAEMFLRKYEGAKREDVQALYPNVDYDARYLNPCTTKASELYKKYA